MQYLYLLLSLCLVSAKPCKRRHSTSTSAPAPTTISSNSNSAPSNSNSASSSSNSASSSSSPASSVPETPSKNNGSSTVIGGGGAGTIQVSNMPSAFSGQNSGIGSWFRTNNAGDSTNGRSWCGLQYQDNWLGFAPSVGTMLKEFSNAREKAGPQFCGLEAKATNPANGNTALIYLVDGFDDKWVLSPGSIDLTLGAFKALYGSETNDKNIVVKNLQWEFTGYRKTDYTYNN